MNSRPVVIFAVVVAIIVGAAIYFLNQDTAPHAAPQTNSTPAPAVNPPGSAPGYTVNSSPQSPASSSQPPVVPKPGVPVPPSHGIQDHTWMLKKRISASVNAFHTGISVPPILA